MLHMLLLLPFCSWMIQLTLIAVSESVSLSSMEHIVYMEKTLGSQHMIELQHIHTLASVLASEGAARKAIVYCYKNTISGFSAMLTKGQVEELSKQPAYSRSFLLQFFIPTRVGHVISMIMHTLL